VNLCIDQPRKVINLGNLEFVKFITADMYAEYMIQGATRTTSSCYIFFLARQDGVLSVFCYKEYPWVKRNNSENPHSTLYILEGNNLYGNKDNNQN